MKHYREVRGIRPNEKIPEIIKNCKGCHCITWDGTYDFNFEQWKCIRCGKLFYVDLKGGRFEDL